MFFLFGSYCVLFGFCSFFFFFNDTATTEIYTLSLHDALPISSAILVEDDGIEPTTPCLQSRCSPDRKSTRLNSSHTVISYAVFCLKKKKKRLRTKCDHQRSIMLK